MKDLQADGDSGCGEGSLRKMDSVSRADLRGTISLGARRDLG